MMMMTTARTMMLMMLKTEIIFYEFFLLTTRKSALDGLDCSDTGSFGRPPVSQSSSSCSPCTQTNAIEHQKDIITRDSFFLSYVNFTSR